MGVDGPFQTVLEPETVRQLERKRIETETEFTQFKTLLEGFKAAKRDDLRKSIPTAFRDEHMDRYLADLGKTEQQYTVMSKDFGPEHPEVVRLLSLMGNINEQIESRIDGVLKGLELQVAMHKAILDKIEGQLQK